MNFDETELKMKSDHTSNNKVKLFRENIVVIEDKWFDDMNLTYGASFPTALIKYKKYRIKQKNNVPRDRKWHIRKIVINNSRKTQIVQILRGKCYGNFIFKRNVPIRIPNPVELSHK